MAPRTKLYVAVEEATSVSGKRAMSYPRLFPTVGTIPYSGRYTWITSYHQSSDYRVALDTQISKACFVLSMQLSAFDALGSFHHVTEASAIQYPVVLV